MPSPQSRAQRVLIVEDQMLVALDLADLIRKVGYVPVGPVGHVADAIEMVANEPLDAALLDFDLDGESSEPVSEALTQRGIPFAMATAYPPDALPPRLRDRPRIGKPFADGDVIAILAALLSLV